ncbi:response regulator [Olleya namhaensis]|uniref:Response regulator receiver domain-containing protein n=1 Tax=Olleya namhaensis TaxID=1144750 RepID=A0A1I3ITB4_9FLAO|nr:response regulator [Olleya namhaensis]SFI51070.1 Response regulator receiver domain-containing protein [Olleya namhaensis]
MKHIDTTCLIDDDRIFIFAAKRILKATNFCNNFTIYNNGAEALTGLRDIIKSGNNIPDLILLDLNMPIMDGWQFLDEFVKIENSKKTTLYIVSSSIDPADSEKAKQYEQITDFIVKPITKDALTEIVNTINTK